MPKINVLFTFGTSQLILLLNRLKKKNSELFYQLLIVECNFIKININPAFTF